MFDVEMSIHKLGGYTKEDVITMLTEILTDFDNQIEPNSTRIDCESIIEQKINSLKED